MKLFLEEEIIVDNEKTWKKIKEIPKIEKYSKGQSIHKCRHDEGKSCERV